MKNKISKHTEIIQSPDIFDICRPLEHLDITTFAHAHINKKGQFSGLTNNSRFSDHYLKNGYYNSDIHMAQTKTLGKFVVWDALPICGQTDKLYKDCYDLGVKHTFSIIENTENGTDFYHFSTNLESTIINQTYLANFDLLNMFILHFKEKIRFSKELLSVYDITFSLNQNLQGFELGSEIHNIKADNSRSKFIEELSLPANFEIINLNTDHTAEKLDVFNLSKRELECLRLTILGKRAKQVSFELGLSRRTVEEYLDKVKVKMEVYSKAELIEKAIKILT